MFTNRTKILTMSGSASIFFTSFGTFLTSHTSCINPIYTTEGLGHVLIIIGAFCVSVAAALRFDITEGMK